MENSQQIIDAAVNGKYSEFAEIAGSIMKNKLNNHEVIQNYTNEYSKYASMKAAYRSIIDEFGEKDE